MGENSKIEWTSHTMNFWIGCRKVSPACASCYAGTFVQNRMGKNFYPPSDLGRLATDADSPVWRTKTWREPIAWDRASEDAGETSRVFTCSLSDFFLDHPGVHEWRREAWKMIRATPNLLWLVLSKRWDLGSEYIRRCLPDDWGTGYPNVMIGATVESQAQVPRIQVMSDVSCQRGRFVSIEPMVGPVDLGDSALEWVIVGGESGSKPRPMHPTWARGLRDWCARTGTPFHFKQWGEWAPRSMMSVAAIDAFWTRRQHGASADWGVLSLSGKWHPETTGWNGRDDGQDPDFEAAMIRVGKKAAGRSLDGRTWDDGPSATIVSSAKGKQ